MRANALLGLIALSGWLASRRRSSTPTAFDTVYQVLLHPRCANCHPAGDAPLQFDDGRPHGQNITHRSEANGLPCASCHRAGTGRSRTRRRVPELAPAACGDPDDLRRPHACPAVRAAQGSTQTGGRISPR